MLKEISECGLILTADTPWMVSGKEPEPLRRALEDVQRDWYKVFGHTPVIVNELPASWNGLAVDFRLLTQKSADRASLPAMGRESFTLEVRSSGGSAQAIVASAADLRGALYAVYAFSEQLLGVDPWWYWADKEPARRENIAVPAEFRQHAASPTCKYRGWYINDEDLLSGFSPDPLRENVFSLELLDRICETLLRLRGNVLVPATWPFPDERCYEFVARRGLAIGMYWPVGMNMLRWPEDVPYSYSKHPEIIERYWQECIDEFKDKEVVWSVCYNGIYRSFRPSWSDEPGVDTPEARGQLFTRAIAKQVEMIRKVQPDAPIVFNLWKERVKLYLDGFIQLPTGVTVVWTDDGAGFMRDAGQVRAGTGMLYHTMKWNFANGLSEFAPPERIYHEMGRCIRAGATEYFLLNVGEVRPAPLSTECAMRMAWDARPYLSRSDQDNQRAFLLEWTRRQFGAEVSSAVADLYQEYFAIPGRQPKMPYWEPISAPSASDQATKTEVSGAVPRGDNAPHAHLQDLCTEALPLMQRGQPLSSAVLENAAKHLQFAQTNSRYFAPLLHRAEALAGSIPPDRRDFYQAHVLAAIGINLHSNEMLEHYCHALQSVGRGDHGDPIHHLERALAAIDAVFGSLPLAQQGKWAVWYIGEGHNGLEFSRDQIRLSLAALRGEPAPPSRNVPRSQSFSRMYQYQERFHQNFPLLYGAKSSQSGHSLVTDANSNA
ncbi:glycosyl hydrolase 115 family protein [Kribbella sp. NPDC050820]|uniref:glycosyl hydrolase 115 family protein n=1 Tax=Kribbella sp. NPDC050820 TaxID=3155408 RepID=UPI0033E306A7